MRRHVVFIIVIIIYHRLKKKKKRFEPEQIALAPLLECAPQCGIEEEDGSAEEEEYE